MPADCPCHPTPPHPCVLTRSFVLPMVVRPRGALYDDYPLPGPGNQNIGSATPCCTTWMCFGIAGPIVSHFRTLLGVLPSATIRPKPVQTGPTKPLGILPKPPSGPPDRLGLHPGRSGRSSRPLQTFAALVLLDKAIRDGRWPQNSCTPAPQGPPWDRLPPPR